ncbi:MAG: immunoglobulin-like domain-containing protein [Eubacterium sp.]|jgi:bacillolysin / insecticidal delta-endotoxin protein|uniref:immunoglobulin-like domain-containing protein n=1 Tax=Eubacterium sp. TaxID=142586 RepID=UPI000338E743|nr:putative uncharacterized protein [Eubacterium sp. CAG:192]
MTSRYKIISEKDYTNYIFENCPIRIETIRILADSKIKKNLVQFKLTNISDGIIDNVALKVEGYDVTNTKLITIDDVLLGALDVKPREVFGGQNPIELDDPRVSYAQLYINRIAFKNGEEWYGTEKIFGVKAETEEQNIYFQEQLDRELEKCAGIYKFQTKCMYKKYDKYWRCSCGHINNLTSKTCYYCGADIHVLSKCFSEGYLKKKVEEAEIARKDKIYIMAKSAEECQTEKKLQEAIDAYKQIKEWKDSGKRLELCLQKMAEFKAEREEYEIKAKKRKKRWCISIGIVIGIALSTTISVRAYQKIALNRKLDEIAESLVLKNNRIKIGTQIVSFKDLFEGKNGVCYYDVKNYSVLKTDKAGKYTLIVEAKKDELIAEKKVVIEVYDDEVPKLSADNVSIRIGEEFDEYSNVKCSDNSGEDIQPRVVESNVNTSKAGTYKIVYEAKDSSGNVTSLERKVKVH